MAPLISGSLVRLHPFSEWKTIRLRLPTISHPPFFRCLSFPRAHFPSIHTANLPVIFSYFRLPGKLLNYARANIDKVQQLRPKPTGGRDMFNIMVTHYSPQFGDIHLSRITDV